MGLGAIFLVFSILTLPLTNAFALGTYSNFSFLFLALSVIFNIRKKIIFFYVKEYLIIFMIFILLILSLWIGGIHKKTLLNLRGYIFALMYFIGFLISFFNSNINKNKVIKFASFAIMFAMVYGIIDFILANIFNIYLDNYIYRYSAQGPLISLGNLVRIRSFTQEPGHFAFFLNGLVPIAIYYF